MTATLSQDPPRRTSITRSAIILAFAGIASRLLGLVRDRLLASQFGASDVLDAYYAAFRIPDLLFDLLVLGAVSAAFIPLFTDFFSSGDREKARRFASDTITLVVCAIAAVALPLIVVAPFLMTVLVPGFSDSMQELATHLTRIMLLSPLFLGISAVCGGILMAQERFVFYALSPLFYNAGIIGGILFLVPFWGPSALGCGVVIGAILHALVQWADVRSSGFRFAAPHSLPWKNPAVQEAIGLMIPRTLGIAGAQISILFTVFLASLTQSGSLAAFTFANNIQSVFLGLVGVPFAVAAFPRLAQLSSLGDKGEFSRLFVKYFRRIFFLIVPATILLIVLRAQIVRVLLGSGKFNWEDTITTFSILGILALSLIAQCLIPLLARSFYALKDTRTPLVGAIVALVANVSVAWALLPSLGPVALAVGFSLGSGANFMFLLYELDQRLAHTMHSIGRNMFLSALCFILATIGAQGITFVSAFVWLTSSPVRDLLVLFSAWIAFFVLAARILRIDRFFFRTIAAAWMMALVIQVMKLIIGTVTDLSTFSQVATQLLLSGGIGVATYVSASWLFNIDEYIALKKRLFSRIMRLIPQPRSVSSGGDVDAS